MINFAQQFILFTIFLVITGYNVHAVEKKIVTKRLTKDYIFISNKKLKRFPVFWQDIVLWPTDKQISENKDMIDEKSVKQPIKSSIRWVKNILRQEWVPEYSNINIYPLKAYANGADAIYFRYQINNYAIQIVQTSWCIFIIVKDRNKKASLGNTNITEASKYVSEILDLFFQKSDKIKDISMTKVNKLGAGFCGKPAIKSASSSYWWGLMSWWTDGQTVLFGTGKQDGGAWVPSITKEWFAKKSIANNK